MMMIFIQTYSNIHLLRQLNICRRNLHAKHLSHRVKENENARKTRSIYLILTHSVVYLHRTWLAVPFHSLIGLIFSNNLIVIILLFIFLRFVPYKFSSMSERQIRGRSKWVRFSGKQAKKERELEHKHDGKIKQKNCG